MFFGKAVPSVIPVVFLAENYSFDLSVISQKADSYRIRMAALCLPYLSDADIGCTLLAESLIKLHFRSGVDVVNPVFVFLVVEAISAVAKPFYACYDLAATAKG